MTERVVAIIQARMGSQRFPGKMMEPLEGEPLMAWVLRRCLRAQRLDGVVLATTKHERDDVLCAQAEHLGVPVYRGSEADVLARYDEAAAEAQADIVVRICADRPLVAPEVVDLAVKTFQDQRPDLAYNHISGGGQRWPRGFGAEVLSRELLHWLAVNTTQQAHREHVTLYVWDRREDYDLLAVPCPDDIDPGEPDIALDVDHPADLERLREICAGCDIASPAGAIMARWRQWRAAHAAA